MGFFKKRNLKKKYNNQLLNQFIVCKEEYGQQKKIYEASYSSSKEMEYSYKLAEAKYFWLLKEVKSRNLSMN